MKRSKSW